MQLARKTTIAALIFASAFVSGQSFAWTPKKPYGFTCGTNQTATYISGAWACVSTVGSTQPPTTGIGQLAVYDSSTPPRKVGTVVQADMHYAWVLYEFTYSGGAAKTILLTRKASVDDASDYTDLSAIYFEDDVCSSPAHADDDRIDQDSLMSPVTAVFGDRSFNDEVENRAMLFVVSPAAEPKESFAYNSVMYPHARYEHISTMNPDNTVSFTYELLSEAYECVSESGLLNQAVELEEVEDLYIKFTPPFQIK